MILHNVAENITTQSRILRLCRMLNRLSGQVTSRRWINRVCTLREQWYLLESIWGGGGGGSCSYMYPTVAYEEKLGKSNQERAYAITGKFSASAIVQIRELLHFR